MILTYFSRDEMEKMVKERCLQRWFSETNPWDGQVDALKDLCGYAAMGFRSIDGAILLSKPLENYGVLS